MSSDTACLSFLSNCGNSALRSFAPMRSSPTTRAVTLTRQGRGRISLLSFF